MKTDFQRLHIGLVVLTILLLGVMAIAQNGGPSTPKTCVDAYPDKAGKCDINQCKAECLKKRTKGVGKCLDTGGGHMQCRCYYQCP